MFQYLHQHCGKSEKQQEALNMTYSSWSTDDKSIVIQPLLGFTYSVLLYNKLDALEEFMMHIPDDASFTFEGHVITDIY